MCTCFQVRFIMLFRFKINCQSNTVIFLLVSFLKTSWFRPLECMCMCACTCPPSCFIRGCSSLKRSYPWWKNVKWAYMKDSIWTEDRNYSKNQQECMNMVYDMVKTYCILTDFRISDLLLDWSTLICNDRNRTVRSEFIFRKENLVTN